MKIPEIHWREAEPFEVLCICILLACVVGMAFVLAVMWILSMIGSAS